MFFIHFCKIRLLPQTVEKLIITVITYSTTLLLLIQCFNNTTVTIIVLNSRDQYINVWPELGVTRYLCSALRNNITFCSKK